jgi:hypothetical protein
VHLRRRQAVTLERVLVLAILVVLFVWLVTRLLPDV